MTIPIMSNLRKAISRLKNQFNGDLKCIETGTIRSYTEKHNSTLHISEALGNRGFLISVDIDPKSIEISKNICKKIMNVKWICLDSIKYLEENQDIFHFAFLDTKNDKDHIFEEFKLIVPKMVVGGIIIVDDAGVDISGNIDITDAEKGYEITKFLKSLGYVNFVCSSPHGTQLWIDISKEIKAIFCLAEEVIL